MALDSKVGVMPIPGKGTDTNVPLDAGNANVFVATNEAAAFDLDAPVMGRKVMTLVKYTKKLQLSVELIRDEDSGLMTFLEDYVGRAAGLTVNSALMTKVWLVARSFRFRAMSPPPATFRRWSIRCRMSMPMARSG
jgi:hypothetical protein